MKTLCHLYCGVAFLTFLLIRVVQGEGGSHEHLLREHYNNSKMKLTCTSNSL